jgi:GTP-binding protein
LHFIDEARLTVRGGRGGDGSVSFHREKFVPRGGPDGGHGGDGGSVIFRATEDLSTLEPHAFQHLVKAKRGLHGSGDKRAGERGADITLDVPVGTRIYEDGTLLSDLSEPGQTFVAARGGEGGRGNSSFANSTRQAPAFRELGLPGEERELSLELRVLSDVGLVGLPNAGKSSLLAAVSAARPKVGDYPFTTLSPKLGVVDDKAARAPFTVADIPGLISGASQGRGLGNQFLRHVARARVLVLILDASEDPEGSEGVLRAELAAAGLSEKPLVLALNKVDLLDEELRSYLEETFPGAVHVSAYTGEGLEELRAVLQREVREQDETQEAVEEHAVYRPSWNGLRVERDDEGRYVVLGEEAARLSLKTDWSNREALEHFQRELERKGVLAALRRAGAEEGDEIRIGEQVFDLQ